MSLLVLFSAPEKRTDSAGLALHNKITKIIILSKKMRLFKNIPTEKIGNFILTVITAFVSTFLMQSCMNR